MRMQRLHLPGTAGGIGMPHLRFYNIACMLRYAIDWIKSDAGYANRELEDSLNDKWSVDAILHSHFYSLPPRNKTEHTVPRYSDCLEDVT